MSKKEGIVITRQEPRSLVFQTPNSIVRRNRRMVRRSLNTEPPLLSQPSVPPEQYKYREEVVPVAEQSPGPTQSTISEMWSSLSETWKPVSESVFMEIFERIQTDKEIYRAVFSL